MLFSDPLLRSSPRTAVPVVECCFRFVDGFGCVLLIAIKCPVPNRRAKVVVRPVFHFGKSCWIPVPSELFRGLVFIFTAFVFLFE